MLILLMEDEPVIAHFIRDEAERQGNQVLNATNVAEAFQLCEQYRPRYALLNFRQTGATDGMAFAREFHRRFNIRVLFLTGARLQDIEAAPDFKPLHRVLLKPFTFSQLKRTLAVFLNESPDDAT